MGSWSVVSWILTKRQSGSGAAAGAVAGLVAITPAAGFVGVMPALIIGGCPAQSVLPPLNWFTGCGVDDSLDVFGIHGVGGMWGAVATGIFVGIGFGALGSRRIAAGTGFLPGSRHSGRVCWSFVMTSIILLVLEAHHGSPAQ